jgi:glycosyltransferase involved in cell wall biosynthesis
MAEQKPPLGFYVVDLHNCFLLGVATPLKDATGLPVCCTLQGEDLFLDGMREPYRSQALALIREQTQYIDAFIAVSDYYADFMADYLGVPRRKIHVVPLGINLNDYESQSAQTSGRKTREAEPFTIGYFARVAPEKGLHVLAEAYRLLRQRNDFPSAKLEAAGYLAPEHGAYLQEIEGKMSEAGLAEEFRYHGAVGREAKLKFFQNVDVLSVPTTYAEAKGLSVIEAMASGVPVVQPRWGSFPEIVERTRGGLLCEPNDAASLAETIYSLWKNPELASDLARRGAAGVRQHYGVQQMAERAVEVYASLNNNSSI